MKNIIITGGAGFIGSHFTDFLVNKGYSTIVIDDLSYGKISNLNPKSVFLQEDIVNKENLEKILIEFSPSHVVHFAANATTKTSAMGWNDPIADYKINMVGTLNLLEIIRKNKLDTHFIYASSAAVYGEPKNIPIDEFHIQDPLSPYGVSKLTGEKYCNAYFKEFGIKTTIMRIFNTYGPRQPRYVMYDQIRNVLKTSSKSIKVLGTGEQIRDYVYVDDTVSAFYLALQKPEKSIGQTFNIGGNTQITIKNLIDLIVASIGKDVKPDYTGESWHGDIKRLWADSIKIQTLLGWQPRIPLEEGLHLLINWTKEEIITD